MHPAGDVPWSRRNDGEVDVLLVHRPHYDDWTFPKRKVQAGKSDGQAALHEVEEETGLRCELGAELAGTTYRGPQAAFEDGPVLGDAAGRRRCGRSARSRRGRMAERGRAAGRLTYERDLVVLASLDRVL